MTQRECDDFLEAVLFIGKSMIQFGAEVWRVEDTISRICKAYNISRIEVYASTTLIVATIKSNSNVISNQSVRVWRASHNLGGLEALNGLSRYICSATPDILDIKEMATRAIGATKMSYYNGIGYILAAGAFTIFFGGTLIDGIVASIISIVVFLGDKIFDVSDSNKLIYIMIMSAITGSLGILLTKVGLGENVDKIIIGTVMLFIPALSLVNGVKDMVYRDIMTGVFRVIEAVLIATAIACGFTLSVALLGGIL